MNDEIKLEVGMYIRINNFISKIEHINTSKRGYLYIQFKQPNGLLITMNTNQLRSDVKTSFNIIDLIEVGDYVNNGEVIKIMKELDEIIIATYSIYDNKKMPVMRHIKEENIKSIVTKEQFKACKYVIGE